MKTISIRVGSAVRLALGRQGENQVRQIVFDFVAWAKEYGDGTVTLLCKRSGDTEVYPVALTIDGTNAAWMVSSTDTAYSGAGEAELVYTAGEAVAKSVVYETYTEKSIGPATDIPPEPYTSWVDTLTALGGETQMNAAAAETAAENAAKSATAGTEAAQKAEDAATGIEHYVEEAAEAAASAEAWAAKASSAQASVETAAQNADTSATTAEAARKAAEAAKTAAESARDSSSASARAAEASAAAAEAWASTPPYIGDNGRWYVYDATARQYVDSGVEATGPQGEKGDPGETGPQGPQGESSVEIVRLIA